jgi:hypothetical protein
MTAITYHTIRRQTASVSLESRLGHDAFCPRENGHKPKYYVVLKLQNVYYRVSSSSEITFLPILKYFPGTKVANAMFFHNVLALIVVDPMSKKHRVHIHWIRFKTQRRHILEALSTWF